MAAPVLALTHRDVAVGGSLRPADDRVGDLSGALARGYEHFAARGGNGKVVDLRLAPASGDHEHERVRDHLGPNFREHRKNVGAGQVAAKERGL